VRSWDSGSASRCCGPVPLATTSRLAAEASDELVSAGATVIEEGSTGDDFYVIVGGRAGVWVDGDRV